MHYTDKIVDEPLKKLNQTRGVVALRIERGWNDRRRWTSGNAEAGPSVADCQEDCGSASSAAHRQSLRKYEKAIQKSISELDESVTKGRLKPDRRNMQSSFVNLTANRADATELIKLAVSRSNRFFIPKSHNNAPKVEPARRIVPTSSHEGTLLQLKSRLKDVELSRVEAQEVLVSAGKLDAKAVSASTLRAQTSLPTQTHSRE